MLMAGFLRLSGCGGGDWICVGSGLCFCITLPEGGRACFAAAQKLAQTRGWAFNWRKVETPGIGHEAAFMFAAKEAGDALFGK